MPEDPSPHETPAAGRPRRPARGPQPRLSPERIVETAISLADAGGLEGIGMRSVAAALGAGAMSLYRHVRDKEELLDLMLDEVFGEIPLGEGPAGDWRAELAWLARESRVVFRRHPWLRALLTARPTLGPNYLRWFERSLAAVAPLGLGMPTMVRMVGALYAYVGGVVSYELAEAENDGRTGLSEAEKRAYAAPLVERLVATGGYPNLARFFAEGASPDPDEGFEFGLECLIRGFDAYLRDRVG